MSLQLAANHLAAQGRGPDTMLVHMAPSEVKSLQSIAMAHGGSLTTNPQTGLPEAGFLKNLLPMIAGMALAPLTAGTSLAFLGTPMGAALTVGGLQGLRTGSLKKGVMAGLGAYGGAGLAGGLAQSGIQAGLAPELAAAQTGVQQVASAVPSAGLAPEAVGQYATDILSKTQPYVNASNAATQAFNTGSFADRLGTIGQGVKSLGSQGGLESFMQNVGGAKKLMQYGSAAAAPALSSMLEPKTSVAPVDSEQYRYSYDPGRQMPPTREGDIGEYTFFRPSYTRLNPTTAMAANGGLMDLPVERMSDRNDAMMGMANGGQMYAAGGLSHLGDYSDGGRLLRGPGDGVSDDIPATIANKRPARLADGEFVVPARIVSELGNGSTEAGARKLYAMMDRVQKNRGKTVGKGKVAVDSRSEKLLPA